MEVRSEYIEPVQLVYGDGWETVNKQKITFVMPLVTAQK
jgi:hypothetical protein